MGINEMYDKNSCMLGGRDKGLENWSWDVYKAKKVELGDKLILVDMIGQPVLDSIPATDDLLSGKYAKGTTFALYCHSGGSSSYMQMQLSPMFPEYIFVNIAGGIMSYNLNFNEKNK